MKMRQFEVKADLSEVLGDLKVVASSIGPDGELCLLLVAEKFEKQPFGREEKNGFAIFPFSKARNHYAGLFIRFNGQVL